MRYGGNSDRALPRGEIHNSAMDMYMNTVWSSRASSIVFGIALSVVAIWIGWGCVSGDLGLSPQMARKSGVLIVVLFVISTGAIFYGILVPSHPLVLVVQKWSKDQDERRRRIGLNIPTPIVVITIAIIAITIIAEIWSCAAS